MIPGIGEKVKYFKCFGGGQAHGQKAIIEAKVVGHQDKRPAQMTSIRIQFELNGVLIKRMVKLDSVERFK